MVNNTEPLLVDANVILEILLRRDMAEYCLNVCLEYPALAISPTSLHIIYYYTEKATLDLQEVSQMLEDMVILTFTESEFSLALEIFAGKDMEDALQIATAINNKVRAVFTLDENMIKKYKNYIDFVS